MAVSTVLVAVTALAIGVAASYAVARRRSATGDPQQWQQLQAQLSPRDRRTVALAVREGRAVDDLRLRPAASALARTLIDRVDRLQRPSRWRRWMWVLLAVTTVAAVVGLAFDPHSWRHVTTLAVNAVFAVAMLASRRLTVGVAARARAALAANEA